MKKLLLLFLLTLTGYLGFSNATVTQKEWRWRKDNGTETSAAWVTGQDQAPSMVICSANDTIRLRIGFEVSPDPSTTNPASKTTGSQISYSTSPTGPWTLINTSNANAFMQTSSAYVVDGTGTTQQLAHSVVGTYAGGQVVDKNHSANIVFTTPSGVTTITEYEWIIIPTASVQVQTYYFVLGDVNSNPATLPSLIITAAPTISAGAVLTSVSCKGGANGTINLTPSGGISPYTFDWGGGVTSEDRTGLGAGTYTVKITDANGCEETAASIITEPTAISSSISATTNVSCNGGSNGSLTVTASGGTGTLGYSWSPSGGTSATASGLAAGSYTVTVTDANGCMDTESATITQPTAISSSISATTNVSCNGESNGSLTVTASGGTGTLGYSWAPSGGTSATASGLAAGSYTVTVTDANGCTDTETAAITQPTAITVSAVQDIIGCTGSNGGSADATASGGTGTLAYSWSPSGGTSATAINLAPGTYTVTVTDANLCASTDDVTITEEICTGINNSNANPDMNVSLYPNPSFKGGTVTLDIAGNVKIEKITLRDAQGRVLMTVSQKEDLMIQNLEMGIYMVEIITDKGAVMKKLLIE